MRKRMMEGWGCHNLKALAKSVSQEGDNQVFCVSWYDGHKTYSAIYNICSRMFDLDSNGMSVSRGYFQFAGNGKDKRKRAHDL